MVTVRLSSLSFGGLVQFSVKVVQIQIILAHYCSKSSLGNYFFLSGCYEYV